MSLLGLLAYNNKFRIIFTYIKGKKCERRWPLRVTFVYVVGPGEKEDKAGLCVENRARRLNVLEC